MFSILINQSLSLTFDLRWRFTPDFPRPTGVFPLDLAAVESCLLEFSPEIPDEVVGIAVVAPRDSTRTKKGAWLVGGWGGPPLDCSPVGICNH